MSLKGQILRRLGNLVVPGFYGQISSGLGNQMFQYAALRALAARTGSRAQLAVCDFGNDYAGRVFELEHFDIKLQKAPGYIDDIFIRSLGLKGRIIKNITKDSIDWYNKAHVVEPNPSIYNKEINKCKAPAYLQGYWQSYKYFEDANDLIRNDFTLLSCPSAENHALAQEMSARNSIAVHVRLGDYANHPQIRESHGVLPLAYYEKAIEAILANHWSSTHFYVFSDEPSVAQDLMKWPSDTIFVDHNKSSSSVWDMWLMSQCKHQIIANSTYSWWAAWLNANTDKTIIAPTFWKKQNSPDLNDLLPPKWIRI